MAPTLCHSCGENRAQVIRPKNHAKLCKTCFISVFESEIHQTIVTHSLFQRGEQVAIGASGGKDSTVLAAVLKTLNERHDYGLELQLLSIDEGIKGYRDDSLATVKRNAEQYEMPLTILGYDVLYGWTMDAVVKQTGGMKGSCTYCGVFRRQALDRGAAKLGVRHVVTGHNADDIAETVMMNLLRGDLPRLKRGAQITTEMTVGKENGGPDLGGQEADGWGVKRSKPLMYAYEKEIVLYAHYRNLEYFSTECVYAPEAFRGSARTLIKSLERIRPSAILDVVRSGLDMAKLVPDEVSASARTAEEGDGGCGSASGRSSGGEMAVMEKRLRLEEAAQGREVEIKAAPKAQSRGHRTSRRMPQQTMRRCERCGYLSSQAVCKACTLLEGLNKSKPKVEIGVAGVERHMQEMRLSNT